MLAVLGLMWYKAPIDLMNLEPNKVLEIVIFNGNTGETTHIENEDEIAHIINELNSIKLKREKISLGSMGYSFKTTIYLKNGEEYDGWNNFIINSSSTIRKNPFFYSVYEGSLDYEYINSIVK